MKVVRIIPALMLAMTSLPLAHAQGLKLTPAGELSFETLRMGNAAAGVQRTLREDGATTGLAYATEQDPLTSETSAGLVRPLADNWSTLFETSYANGGLSGLTTEWSMLGQIGTTFGAGWGVQAGLRHSELGLRDLPLHANTLGKAGSADIGMLTLERYWDRYRGAYTYFSGRGDNGANTSGHRVQLDYFYGARSSIGLAYTLGQPRDPSIGLGNAWLDTTNIGLMGEHWFTRSWAVNYNALVEDPRNGAALRPELRVGLRLRF